MTLDDDDNIITNRRQTDNAAQQSQIDIVLYAGETMKRFDELVQLTAFDVVYPFHTESELNDSNIFEITK